MEIKEQNIKIKKLNKKKQELAKALKKVMEREKGSSVKYKEEIESLERKNFKLI